MPSKYWIKLYHEILDDPKMGRLTDRLFRRTMQVFLLAGEQDDSGRLPSMSDMAWRFRVSEEELETDLADLASTGIVRMDDNQWIVTRFADRQAPVSSTDRVRYYRERTKHFPRDKITQQEIYEKYPHSPGIYKIQFRGDDRYYIGSSKDICNRVEQHLTEMRNMDSSKLHKPYMKFGFDNIEITILERTDNINDLPLLETEWLKKFNPEELYNVELAAGRHRNWNANETNRSIDTDIDLTDAEPEKAADAVEDNPTNLDEWLKSLRNGKNKQAILMRMTKTLYPDLVEYPTYAYLGSVAKKVGGAGRLASLLWECVTKDPKGDLLSYVQAYAKGGKSQSEPAGFPALRNVRKKAGLDSE